MTRPTAILNTDRAVTLAGVAVAASVVLAAMPGHPTADGGAQAATVVPRSPPALDLAPIHRFAPFGRAAAVPGADGVVGLELRGIVLVRPQSASSALIAVAGSPARAFAAGDTLPGGAILDAVEADLVVLRVDGALRTLGFPVRGKAGEPVAAAAMPAGSAAETDDAPPANEPDPLSLLGSLGATATPQGYRVGAVPSDEMRRAGLLAGDIVEKVDGAAVGDPVHDRALYDAAVDAGTVRVDVVRGGKHLALSLPLP